MVGGLRRAGAVPEHRAVAVPSCRLLRADDLDPTGRRTRGVMNVNLRRRLERLEARAVSPNGGQRVVIHIPDNGRDGSPPGRYPCPNGNVLVVYAAGQPPEG